MQNTMKAALIHSFDGLEKVSIEDIPIPTPKNNEVQIRVKYAGVNPVDWKIADGLLKTRMEYQFPITLGWDVSGKITQLGKEVKKFTLNDSVFAYCRKEKMHEGSFAEFICLPADQVVKKPTTITFAEAAALPLVALTAWQALYDIAQLEKEEIVLIHAGAGGVGSIAIQLAKLKNAHVITTASLANFDYVKTLGADEIIDYTKEDFVSALLKKHPQGIDVVYDTVGGETLKSSYSVLRVGGRLVTISGIVDQALASEKQIHAEYLFVQPDGEELAQIAQLAHEKKLKIPRIETIPFEEVVSALRKSREGHTQGKLILSIQPD